MATKAMEGPIVKCCDRYSAIPPQLYRLYKKTKLRSCERSLRCCSVSLHFIETLLFLLWIGQYFVTAVNQRTRSKEACQEPSTRAMSIMPCLFRNQSHGHLTPCLLGSIRTLSEQRRGSWLNGKSSPLVRRSSRNPTIRLGLGLSSGFCAKKIQA